MRSRTLLSFAVVLALGLAGLLVVGLTTRDDRSQTLGVAVAGPVAGLRAGDAACQRPIGLADDVDRVEFNPGTQARVTPPIRVTIRELPAGPVLGSGLLQGGYDPRRSQTVDVGHVRRGPEVELCFRNLGPASVDLFGDTLYGVFCTATSGSRRAPLVCKPGGVRPTISTSQTFVHGQPLRGDIAAVFHRRDARSLLARVPLMVARGALFRPGFVSQGFWWAMIALWLVGLPLLVAGAIRSLARSEP